MNYLQQNFPEACDHYETVVVSTTPATVRKRATVMKIWDHFVSTSNPMAATTVDVSDIVAYMMFRIIGDSNRPYAGRLTLGSFMNGEVRQLRTGLMMRAEKEGLDFRCHWFRSTPHFKNNVELIRQMYNENYQYTHTRPIWWADELRLLAATSHDTAGFQDRAIIRILVNTGVRCGSLSQISIRRHVEEILDYDGSPALRLELPDCKLPNGDPHRVILTGAVYKDVAAWLRRRRFFYPDNPSLFITRTGTDVSTEGVSMMLRRLSAFAGYGEGYFTSHSGRMGFACRKTAEHLCAGRTLQELFDNLSVRGHWAFGSRTVLKYCQTKVARYFEEPIRMRWEEFMALRPETLHDLHDLDPIIRRSNVWFMYPRSLLLRFISDLGLLDLISVTNQTRLRRRIAHNLYRTNHQFASLVDSLAPARISSDDSKLREFSITVLSILLEYEILGGDKTMSDVTEEEKEFLKKCLDEISDGNTRRVRSQQASILPRQVRVHRVFDLEEAIEVSRRIARHTSDRQVNVAILPDGREFVMSYPLREGRTSIVTRLPLLEDVYLTLRDWDELESATEEESSDRESSAGESSDGESGAAAVDNGIDTGDADLSEADIVQTPPPKRAREGITPSTSASF